MMQYSILDKSRHPFIIYKDTIENKYCLDPRKGRNKKKAMIISLPRSGVHLMQEIFSFFDMYHVRISHDVDQLGDYRFLSDQDRINFARNSDVYSFPFAETIKFISEGQFVHSQMRYDDSAYLTLRDLDFETYLLKRDLRSCFISHARKKRNEKLLNEMDDSKLMEEYISSPYHYEILEQVKLMLPWFENQTFETIAFEDLVGQNGGDKQYQNLLKLIEAFDVKKMETDEVINNCINTKTFTYSGMQSDIKRYWNEKFEEWFKSTGADEINRKLGYN